MISNGRTVELKESFTAQLAIIQEYISQFELKKGRELTTFLVNYVLDVVAPNHYIFAEYAERLTPEKMYRRAIFKLKYVIIYKVTDEQVTFLAIYHTSQNPDGISLEEE